MPHKGRGSKSSTVKYGALPNREDWKANTAAFLRILSFDSFSKCPAREAIETYQKAMKAKRKEAKKQQRDGPA